jgi:hypothetical protein
MKVKYKRFRSIAGCYDPSIVTIEVGAELSSKAKLTTLIHELLHHFFSYTPTNKFDQILDRFNKYTYPEPRKSYKYCDDTCGMCGFCSEEDFHSPS